MSYTFLTPNGQVTRSIFKCAQPQTVLCTLSATPSAQPSTEVYTSSVSTSGQPSVAQTFLRQRPCYRRGSPCQDPAGNRTTRRPHDDRKGTQTAVIWSCFPFIRSGQNLLARHSEIGKKTGQTEEEVGRQHQGMIGQTWSSPSPRAQWRTEENGGNWL